LAKEYELRVNELITLAKELWKTNYTLTSKTLT
jgi:hypothetical protein